MATSHRSDQGNLHYRIRRYSKGVRLDIWEIRDAPTPGESPYRFFVTYQLASETEAQQIVGRYLVENGISQAIPDQHDTMPFHLSTLDWQT